MYGVVRQASIYYAAVHAALPSHVHAAGAVGGLIGLCSGGVFRVADRPQGREVRRPLVRPCGGVVGLEELVHLLAVPHRGPDGPQTIVLFRVKIGGLALLSNDGCAVKIGGSASQVKGVCRTLGPHYAEDQIFGGHALCTPSWYAAAMLSHTAATSCLSALFFSTSSRRLSGVTSASFAALR